MSEILAAPRPRRSAKITTMVAMGANGPRIGELVKAAGFQADGLDWSEVHPHWLIAKRDSEIIGCLQIVLSKPMGWLENLSIEPSLSRRAKERTIKVLLEAGLAALKVFGAQLAVGCVPDDLESYIKVLENRGAVNTGHGFVMAKRL